jgi:UDP-N-acetyl-D-glucosamine dehydrogenase
MPRHVAERVQAMLNDDAKPLNGSKILMLGAAYKKNVSDTRVSPALDIMRLLLRGKADVRLCDPHVRAVDLDGRRFESRPLTAELLRGSDPVLFDARNASKGRESEVRGRLEKL